MIWLTRCPKCKSKKLELQQDLLGRYWQCLKCRHVESATEKPRITPTGQAAIRRA